MSPPPLDPLAPTVILTAHPDDEAMCFSSAVDRALTPSEVTRYSRQLLLPPPFGGRSSLLKLLNSRVLVVGCGGLASPLLMYLAGAGVGTIEIVDGDRVDVSNLHRQPIHTTPTDDGDGSDPPMKVHSALDSLRALNPTICIRTHPVNLTQDNAQSLITPSLSLVIDCTDNVLTRYLISDACSLLSPSPPLVSAAAMGTEGTLTTYNYRPTPASPTPPCYRCVYPSPSPLDSSKSCSDSGVLGPTPGLMGTMQAIEAIRVLLKLPTSDTLTGKISVHDSLTLSTRVFSLPLKSNSYARPDCPGCSPHLPRTLPSLSSLLGRLKGPCNSSCPPNPPPDSPDSVDCTSVPPGALVVDVRPAAQFDLWSLPGSVSWPVGETPPEEVRGHEGEAYVVCRRGVSSLGALVEMRRQVGGATFLSVRGGLNEWHRKRDPEVPFY